MAGNIKGITIEFNGDTTKLQKALRQVNDESKNIAAELKRVDAALKFNPGNVDLLKQKQTLLAKQIETTTQKLDVLRDAQKKAADDPNIDKNSAEYRELEREILKCENQLKRYNKEQAKVTAALSPLGKMSATFKDIGTNLTKAGEAMKGFSKAGAAAVATIGALAYKGGQLADELNTLSKRYRISTADLQKYAAAAGLVDVDVDSIAKSHVKLEKSMMAAAKGNKTNVEYFDKLGVAITDANGELRSSDEVWQDVIASLGDVENETERDAIAMQLLGKSASELNPLIEDGGETYAAFAETMQKYNLDFIDQETLDRANQFNDELDTMKGLAQVAFGNLATQLAAYLEPALAKVVEWVGALAEWLSNLDPRILMIIGIIGGLVAVLAPLLIGLGKIAFAISSIMGLISVLGPAIAGIGSTLLPVIAIIGAIIVIGVQLYKNWDTIKAKAIELWNKIKTTFANIKASIINAFQAVKNTVTGIWNSIVSTARSKFNAVKEAVTTPINRAKEIIRTAFNTIKNILSGNISLPHIKLPHFSIVGKFSLNPPSVPHLAVNWYKTGGIFSSPSVIGVGEAGSEAVIPLEKLWSKMDEIIGATGGPVINVYASPGMDVDALAAAVEQRLVQLQKKRQRAFNV